MANAHFGSEKIEIIWSLINWLNALWHFAVVIDFVSDKLYDDETIFDEKRKSKQKKQMHSTN